MANNINGIDGMTAGELADQVAAGGRFMHYQYAISIIFMTFRRASDIYFIPAGDNALVKGLPYTVLSFVFGWWGIPWGPIYTVQSIYRNLSGGTDITYEVLDSLMAPAEQEFHRTAPAAAPRYTG